MTGITKILGFSKFGEFATFTLERTTNQLLNELGEGKTDFANEEIFAEYRGERITQEAKERYGIKR